MDFNKNYQIPFGAYLQVAKDNNPKNTNNPITIYENLPSTPR